VFIEIKEFSAILAPISQAVGLSLNAGYLCLCTFPVQICTLMVFLEGDCVLTEEQVWGTLRLVCDPSKVIREADGEAIDGTSIDEISVVLKSRERGEAFDSAL
jgi:hypothetical protein